MQHRLAQDLSDMIDRGEKLLVESSRIAHIADPTAAAAITASALTVTDGAGTNDGTIPAISTGGAAADQDDTIAAIQELAAMINALVVDVTALKAGVDANNAAIDALNSANETLGFVGSE